MTLVYVFVTHVVHGYKADLVGQRIEFWTFSVVALSSAGLCFLYKITTGDPGFINESGGVGPRIFEKGSDLETGSSEYWSLLDCPALW